MRIAVAGCGALGSQLALHLAHPDHTFLLLDDDRVEEDNLLTTIYTRPHLGCQKAIVLAEMLYHKAGCVAEVHTRTLETGAPIVRWKPDLLIDTFDNFVARALTNHVYIGRDRVPTLHVGVSATRVGAIVWDERYTVPEGPPRGENPICTHELGRPILRLTAALAANVVEHWVATGEQRDVWVTEDGRTYA